MEYPVMMEGRVIGRCMVEDQGLYWFLNCSCEVVSNRVERLYCGTARLGVLLLEHDRLVLHRRISKAACPQLPPQTGVMSLCPTEEPVPWQGMVLGYVLSGLRLGNTLLFPYQSDQPCPCEPLFCFFEIKDGFWSISLEEIPSL